MNSCIPTVQEELRNFTAAAAHQVQAYQSFLLMAQTGNWEEAARCHMQASAMLEASMDAFMRACRIQQLSDGQEDDSI